MSKIKENLPNLKVLGFSVVISLYITLPLIIYMFNFNHSLSNSNQDWGAFGSYLSGVYGSGFGLISLIVLLATLKEMQKTNRQDREHFTIQFKNSEADKRLNDVIMLSEMINKLLENNNTIGNKKSLPYDLASALEPKCTKFMVTEEHELYEAAIDLMRDQRTRFSSEVYVLGQLAKKVCSIEDEDQIATAKAIVKGLISDSYRFWLYCYSCVWSADYEARHYLRGWNDFCSIPAELERYIPDPRDDNEQG